MRGAAWIAATGVGLGLLACQLPDTLGLACERHEHCNPGQHCGPEDTCVAGMVPMMPPPTSGPTDGSGESSASTGMTTGGGTTSTPGTTSGEGSDSSSGDSGSTGQACGAAVGACDAVDVLFVVDNSGSMEDDNARLIPAFANVEQLVEPIVGGLCSYRVGVTTTEVAPDFQPPRCQVRGALSQAGAICPDPWGGDPDHPPWVSESDDIAPLGCLLTVGANYDTDEKQVDTMLAALGPGLQGAGGCNEGFLREGVPLLVVLITDEDDDDDSGTPGEAADRTGSSGDPSDWWDALVAIKDPAEIGLVVLAAVDPATCDPWEPAPGLSDGSGAEYGERLLTFAQHFTGAGLADHFLLADLCQDGTDIVAELAQVHELLGTVCGVGG